MIISDLYSKNLIHPPPWLPGSIQYLVYMGSVAYGCAGNTSDSDLYGWCIPRQELVFPHLVGEIPGFGKQIKRFEQWQEHRIKDDKNEYDIQVYSIVKYFQLCMDNNPNMIDSLFVPEHCVHHITPIAKIIRENRKLFLHKGSYHKFRGFAYSQLNKAEIKNPQPGSKRDEIVKKFGWDVKFGYHLVRLLLEAEEILSTGDLHLDQNGSLFRAIREGQWSLEKTKKWFAEKEIGLESLYNSSSLRYQPDEESIKSLLLSCLEQYYGKIAIITPSKEKKIIEEIRKLVNEN